MEISSLGSLPIQFTTSTQQPPSLDGQPLSLEGASGNAPELRDAFDQFVGETFYNQMLQAMRKTQQPAAYFDGGRAEEAFRNQLDQVLSENMAQSSAGSFTGPMYDLFSLQRK